jgi:UDP-glucose 4-epimerase
VVAIFTQKMLANEQAVINGDGTQTRDFVYVGDVAEANVKAIAYPKSLVVNIGTGKQTTVNEIFDLLVTNTNTTIKKQHGPAKQGEQQVSQLDVSQAKVEFDWKPKVRLADGLAETVHYFKK